MGTGYLFGPVLILAALPLMLGRVGQVVLTRWYRVQPWSAVPLGHRPCRIHPHSETGS
jgi:hypothetical protein